MFTLKNGVLHKDGKPVIALGQSYYASFHEAKFPVPPDGDRVGIMKEDIRQMADCGFQFLRVAALGDLTLEDDAVTVKTDFIDNLLREADAAGMATSVRLQGYVMNLRDHKDYLMLNNANEPMRAWWSAFIRNSLFHEGILQDNREASQALAKHFNNIPGVVSYQIYNEPHYPYNGIFDYHPKTLAAYKKWQEAQGLDLLEAPRSRPVFGEPVEPWIRWRLFSMQALSDFLNNSAADVKAATPEKEVYTCMTCAPARDKIMPNGIEYYDDGEGMDVVGITTYINLEGNTYYSAAYQYDMAECAAALCGKHAWTIESDARVNMPARKLHQETYAQLATAHKGIIFYEWRGDYPAEGTPLPDNCGFIHYDGRKAEHFHRSLDMIRFVNKHSGLFAAAEKLRDGVAVLASNYAAAFADAYMDGSEINIYVHQSLNVYRELRKAGFTADIVHSRHLKENKLGVRVLLIPVRESWLSSHEKEEIDAFVAQGGKAFYLQQAAPLSAACPYGFWPWDVKPLNAHTSEFRSPMEVEDVLERCGMIPNVQLSSRHLKSGILKGEDYHLVILTNTDPEGKDVVGADITTKIPHKAAEFLSPDGEFPLETDGKTVKLPTICEGGVVLLK